MNPKILSIELTPLHVPFKETVRQLLGESEGGLGMAIPAEEPWLGGDFVICKLTADDGNIGIGESFVWLPETGISPNQIINVIKHDLFRYILGESPFNVEKIRYKMNINVALNDVSKGLLDMACYDLMGKITGRPVYDLIGGKTVDEIPLAALIPLADPMLMRGIARSYYKRGFRTFRLKLGNNIQEDIEICEKIRQVLSDEVNLRVDYNQAYTNPHEAIRAIKAIEPFGIDFAEQPVRNNDYLGLAYVQKHVDTPLMSHEDFFTLRDFITLVELKAIGVLGLNSVRPGGVTNALRALDYAEQRGLGAVIHDQPLGIASAMHIHIATARYYSFTYAAELFVIEMMEDDLIKIPLNYEGGTAKVPHGPGWGIELDERAIDKYAVAPSIILK
ncbi:MAG: mandelate racemase/muconate lactonizing enzyme family protein [Candidatus Hodarchaeota archaeon]